MNKPLPQQWVLVSILGIAGLGIGGAWLVPGDKTTILGFAGLIVTNLFIFLKNTEKIDEVKTDLATNNLQTTGKIDEAAEKVQQVSTRLQESDVKTDKKLKQIHETGEKSLELSNGAYTAQLELVAKFARKVADTTNDKVDIALAETAEQALADHIELAKNLGMSKEAKEKE